MTTNTALTTRPAPAPEADATAAAVATRRRRRTAAIAASSGLLVTMGLPAAAAAEPRVEQSATLPEALAAPVVSATARIVVASVAQVELGMEVATVVESSAAEQAEAEVLAAAVRQSAGVGATATALASRESPQASRSADRSASALAATPAVASAGAGVASGSGAGARALAIAQRYAGVPYVWGGTTPSGFDCSGLVQHVYRQVGISLPRVSADQSRAGTRVSAGAARPGDLVAFTGSGGVHHIGIYAGDGMMFDAPRAGKTVGMRKIWSSSVFFTRVD